MAAWFVDVKVRYEIVIVHRRSFIKIVLIIKKSMFQYFFITYNKWKENAGQIWFYAVEKANHCIVY